MKTGKTLVELALEIERQSKAKRDFIASTNSLSFELANTASGRIVTLNVAGQNEFPIQDYAHGQIAAHLDIGKKYYDRMLEKKPELLRENVNTWLKDAPAKERRMIRTLDGADRAFLSDKFNAIDNDMIGNYALEALHEAAPKMLIESCEITQRKMYLKAFFPEIEREIADPLTKVGDIVRSGVMISNSEIGCGSVEVVPYSYKLGCKNGMKHTIFGQRRNHVGRAVEGSDGQELFASDTLRADAKAFLLKLRDVIRACVTPDQFDKIVETMRGATTQKIEGNPVEAVEVMTRKLSFLESEKNSIMRHLIEGGDLSRWGLANAVTRAAADISDYDRATELEALGGRVIELAPKDWKEIALAA